MFREKQNVNGGCQIQRSQNRNSPRPQPASRFYRSNETLIKVQHSVVTGSISSNYVVL